MRNYFFFPFSFLVRYTFCQHIGYKMRYIVKLAIFVIQVRPYTLSGDDGGARAVDGAQAVANPKLSCRGNMRGV